MFYHSFFNDLNTAFWQKDFDYVARQYTMPLPIYVDNVPQVFGNFGEFKDGLANLHWTLCQDGFSRSTLRIVAQSLRTIQTTSVWVEYSSPRVGEADSKKSTVRYMVTGAKSAPSIALIEYRSSLLGLDRVKDIFQSQVA